jgi:hypothetical protein
MPPLGLERRACLVSKGAAELPEAPWFKSVLRNQKLIFLYKCRIPRNHPN